MDVHLGHALLLGADGDGVAVGGSTWAVAHPRRRIRVPSLRHKPVQFCILLLHNVRIRTRHLAHFLAAQGLEIGLVEGGVVSSPSLIDRKLCLVIHIIGLHWNGAVEVGGRGILRVHHHLLSVALGTPHGLVQICGITIL